jgi:general secretion pathway protein D
MNIKSKQLSFSLKQLMPTMAGLVLCAASFTAPAAGLTLNLKDADINAVIQTVSEATGRNFIIDPRVKGKVTIVSSKELGKEDFYQVFLAVLNVHGFAAVPAGDGSVIKIVPEADAKHAGTPGVGKGEEMVTHVVEISHIAAAQLVPILRPLVPPQGHLAAHAQTNTLIIADRVDNIDRLLRIIKKVDEPSGSEIEVVQLNNASAAEVVRIINSLTQKSDKKNPQGSRVTLVADERTNSILIGGEKAQRLRTKAIVAHLDTPSETLGNTNVIYLRYAKADQLVKVLTGVGKVKAKERSKGKKGAASRNAQNFDIQADESSNALVITAAPDVYRSLESVIRKLDVRRAQVLVEAIIAEVSATKTTELGVQWFAGSESPGKKPIGLTNFGSPETSIAGMAAATNAGGAPALNAGLTVGIGSIIKGDYSFGALINALAGDGRANLLSTPNILTMDNEEAEIFVGKEVSVPSGSFTSTGGGSSVSNPFTTFKTKQVGIRLKVKPQVNEGDAIKLEIDQAVDAITAGDAGDSNLVTSTRTIKTSVMVDDGQIVVLGGLITDDQNQTEAKVPFFGDIPVLGALFRYKREANDKTNLMIFLRPEILRDAAVTTEISSGKYNFIRGKQMEPQENDLFRRHQRPTLPALDELLKPRAKQSALLAAPQEPKVEAHVQDILDD